MKAHSHTEDRVSLLHSESAELEKNFPWLKGDSEDHIALKEILLKEENQWLVDLMKMAPLPNRYAIQSHQTLALMFSSFCTACLFLFYFDGSEDSGPMYVAGGLSVNAIQSLYYGVESYFFLKNPGDLINLIAGIVLSGTATGASALSAYQLSKDGFTTGATAVGNFPMNTYGMAGTVKKIRQMCNRNPELKNFWLAQLSKAALDLNGPELQICLIDPKRRCGTIIAGGILGIGLGVMLDFSMAGYVYSSYLAARTFSSKNMSIAISAISNVPTLIIAFFQSGVSLGFAIVNKLADGLQFFASKTRISLTPRQAKFLSLNLIAVALVGFMAYYSNATAKKLAKDIPSFDEYLNAFINFCVANGSDLFNGIMTSIALYDAINYFNRAYENNVKINLKHQFLNIKEWLNSASASELSLLNRKHVGMFEKNQKVAIRIDKEEKIENSDTAGMTPNASRP